jgi:aminoglycoside phosphotransferase (APT) family kinase protein
MLKRLEAFIRQQPAFEKARVEGLTRMPGGASKETWSFDLYPESDRFEPVLPMVLRIERSSPLPVAVDIEKEFLLLREVYAAGVPVPKPYWLGREALGNPFCIVARITGETLVRRLQRDDRFAKARELIPGQLAEILPRIHGLPIGPGRFDFVPRRTGKAPPAMAELLFYENLLHRLSPDPHPAMELVIRWLKTHQPPPAEAVLLHGDYRLGNIIFTEEGVRAVLDWELAHIGDPHEDLGYISTQAWRFGQDANPIGGIGQREDFYRAYEQAGGVPLNRESLYYWEVFGNLKWAAITIFQALPFLQGASSSIELASLGRKTAEVELQMLALIEDR